MARTAAATTTEANDTMENATETAANKAAANKVIHIREHEYDAYKDYGTDLWNVIVDDVHIYPAARGEANFLYIGVNGMNYQVPRGKGVDLPAPLYDRYLIWKDAVDKAIEMREKLENHGKDTELRRV